MYHATKDIWNQNIGLSIRLRNWLLVWKDHNTESNLTQSNPDSNLNFKPNLDFNHQPLQTHKQLTVLPLCRLLAVPLPVGERVFSLSWLLPTYFLFAVTYDVLQTLADVAHYLPSHGFGPEMQVLNLSRSSAMTNVSTLLWRSTETITRLTATFSQHCDSQSFSFFSMGASSFYVASMICSDLLVF